MRHRKVMLMHDSVEPPVWSPASSSNFFETSLARWTAVTGFARAQPSTDRARSAGPQSPPAKLDSDKFEIPRLPFKNFSRVMTSLAEI